jgi:DNA invertase Pin-like site-specific DNA recombinase
VRGELRRKSECEGDAQTCPDGRATAALVTIRTVHRRYNNNGSIYDRVESGKEGDRPELRKALDYCKKNKGAKLIVATMSRLTRDTKFLLALLDGSVDVMFADLPQVPAGAMGRFFLTMMAAVAEFEAGLTSERTKAVLAQVKARGEKRLGNPTNLPEAQRRGAASMKAAADAFAARVLPTIHDIQRNGRRHCGRSPRP